MLDDRPHTVEHHPDRGAGERSLGDGRVDHAVVAELGLEAERCPKGSAPATDVLAHEHDALVLAEGCPQREADRIHIRHDLRHAAKRLDSSSSTGGNGASSAS
jgi:hypothetical protein